MAGTSNFIQWNPSQTNQETDAEYTADSLRSAGAIGGVFPSATGNKLYYQVSTMVAALAGMLAAKGYSTSDSSLSTLEGVLANLLTNADMKSPMTTVAYSSSPSFNCASYNGFSMTLTGNTAPTFSGVSAGQTIALVFVQDSAGSHTVTYPSAVVGGAQPDPSANSVSVQMFEADTGLTLRAIGPMVSSNGMGGLPISAVNPASGAFTSLTANTPATTDNSTNVATTAFVNALLNSRATTMNVVTGSRAFSTVYQNTSGYGMLVAASANTTGGVGQGFNLNGKVGSSSTYLQLIASNSVTNSAGAAGVTFKVPPGYYYWVEWTNDGGSPSPAISSWVEWIN